MRPNSWATCIFVYGSEVGIPGQGLEVRRDRGLLGVFIASIHSNSRAFHSESRAIAKPLVSASLNSIPFLPLGED